MKTRRSLVLISFLPFPMRSRGIEGGREAKGGKKREEKEKGDARLFMPAPSRLKRRGIVNYPPKSCNDPTKTMFVPMLERRGEQSVIWPTAPASPAEKNYRRWSRQQLRSADSLSRVVPSNVRVSTVLFTFYRWNVTGERVEFKKRDRAKAKLPYRTDFTSFRCDVKGM